jgi:hypothetical protein
MGTNGVFESLQVTGSYTDGTSGRAVNIYYGTAGTIGTSGIPDGSLYFQYT